MFFAERIQLTKRIKKSHPYRSDFEYKGALKLKGYLYEPFSVSYVVERDYIPDFVHPNNERILVEFKGFFRKGDQQKYLSIRDSNPDKELVFVFYSPHQAIRRGGKITYAEWAEKHGFRWYSLSNLPKEIK